MDDRNIVITGIPRSGTTLTCNLLNKLPDVVALHEPLQFGQFNSRQEACNGINRFFNSSRKSLLEEGKAASRQIDGQVPDNPVVDSTGPGVETSRHTSEEKSPRKSGHSRGIICVEKLLTADFKLCVKHPAAFTALLELLIEQHPCYAVVRNPLAVLASWNSVSFPVSRGRAPVAERFDQDLAQSLDRCEETFRRQLCLLTWFFETFQRTLPMEHVLRYENVVESGGKACQVITPQATELGENLESRNTNTLYNRQQILRMGEKLLTASGAFWEFYTKASVEALLENIERDN